MITKKDIMLCEKITEQEIPRLKGEWLANVKYDGERIVAIKKGDDIFLINRAGRIKNEIYGEIVPSLKEIKFDFIIDGEIITKDGLFNSLQHRSNLSNAYKIEKAKIDYPISYMVFDILFLKGIDLRNKPLKERINLLYENFKFEELSNVGFVAYEDIQTALSFAKSNNCEGIVIKNMLSNYESRRSKSWLKLKLFKNAEIKVVRYTTNNSGIRAESEDMTAVQIAGNQYIEVKNEIDKNGYCNIVVQYLELTRDNKYRFISFKEINNEK